MPDITLERGYTAALIADFYAGIMDMLPDATGRGVVGKAAAAHAAITNSRADVICPLGAL